MSNTAYDTNDGHVLATTESRVAEERSGLSDSPQMIVLRDRLGADGTGCIMDGAFERSIALTGCYFPLNFEGPGEALHLARVVALNHP